MNSRVKDPGSGQNHIEVFGGNGGSGAKFLIVVFSTSRWVHGSVAGGTFLMKSAFIVSNAWNDGSPHHKSQFEWWVLRFPLTISITYIFSEMGEGFVETEKKLVPHECLRNIVPWGMCCGFPCANGSLVWLQHFHPEVVSVLHQSTCTNVMLLDFFEAKSRVCQH